MYIKVYMKQFISKSLYQKVYIKKFILKSLYQKLYITGHNKNQTFVSIMTQNKKYNKIKRI